MLSHLYGCHLSVHQSIYCSHSSIAFSSETTWPIKAKFHMELLWARGTKVSLPHLGHMIKWPPCPHMVKNSLKNVLRIQRASGPGAWYAELGTWAQ